MLALLLLPVLLPGAVVVGTGYTAVGNEMVWLPHDVMIPAAVTMLYTAIGVSGVSVAVGKGELPLVAYSSVLMKAT